MAASGGEIFLPALLSKFSSVMELGWWLFRLTPSAFRSASLRQRRLELDADSLSDKAKASRRPADQ
jgi:hypothetical protein